MNTLADASQETRDAVAEAVAWRLLSLLLERPRKGWKEEVASLAAECPDGTLKESSQQVVAAREGIYLALLGPGGPVSPRESAYQPSLDPSSILTDLQAFYQAFAFQPNCEEPIDHIATEAGFVGYLKVKEAYARACGDTDALSVTGAALACFCKEHLDPFSQAFLQRLTAVGESYLLPVAAALARRVNSAVRNADATP